VPNRKTFIKTERILKYKMPEMTPEQQAELQEKLKNMSPEELREFQKKQCIFCHIVSGKVQAKKIFEDEKTLAILDINPANPGHILVLPKEHYSIMPQLPDDELTHIFMVAKSLSNVALRSLGVQGTNIIVANGVAAGQRAQHFMVHVIPRTGKDGLEFVVPQKKMSEKDLEQVREKLAAKVAQLMGKSEGIPKSEPPVVEAEFTEPEETQPQQSVSEEPETEEKVPQQKPKTQEKPAKAIKKKPKKAAKPAKKKSSDINLDDIANLLGGK